MKIERRRRYSVRIPIWRRLPLWWWSSIELWRRWSISLRWRRPIALWWRRAVALRGVLLRWWIAMLLPLAGEEGHDGGVRGRRRVCQVLGSQILKLKSVDVLE